jgi:dipeptidyl-peptidase 4
MSNDPINPIPVEEIARWPLPGMAYPTSLAFGPDDRLITYLRSPDFGLTNQLYAYDPQTGIETLLAAPPAAGTEESSFSPEETLRRERKRQLITGITQYAWDDLSGRILYPAAGDIYILDAPGAAPRRLHESHGRPALDPQLSPDGAWVAYVENGELYVRACAAGGEAPHRLTFTAGAALSNGLAEFVAQEEIGRSRGFWWSPDSDRLAFAEVDTSPIPLYRIPHLAAAALGAEEEVAYPFAGQPNARVRLGVISRAGGEPVWMDLGEMLADGYLARAGWLPDGRLYAQLEDRAQRRLDLVTFDPASGARQLWLTETNPTWINLNDLFRPLKAGGFLWGSERSGYRHIYRYDRDGRLVRALTAGDWMVDAIAGVDEAGGWVYFTANRENPTESQLYAVSLEGGEIRRITPEAGTHGVVIDGESRRFVDTFHSTGQPPIVRLRSLVDGAVLATLFDNADPRLAALALPAPQIVTLANRAGGMLYGAIFRPPAHFGPGPYPAIVFVYGGPHAQNVQNGWALTAALRAQSLAGLGFLVFTLDNRGSARRGLAFEAALRGQFGRVEVEDQVDGVRWLVAHGLADPTRVGIYGWSYGGFMAAMCLLTAPETFKAAVAGAPVTDNEGYDTHYTERYLGLPQENPQGYAASKVMPYVAGLTGSLLLVHGLIDENVHFRHTARLVDALAQARKPYELLVLPHARHSVRRFADRVYLEERIRAFFLRELREV